MNNFVFFLVKILQGSTGVFYDHNGFNEIFFEADKIGIKIGQSIDGSEVLIDGYTVFINNDNLFLV